MQCVLICAGKGTRMLPLTESLPKPLISVCGKPLLDHVVEALPSEITDLILVVGYRQAQIREYCGTSFHGRAVTYCEQQNYAGGTGDALRCAAGKIDGKFLFMYADDIHGAAAVEKVVQEDHAMLGMHSDTPQHFGVLEQHEDGTLKEIVEKPAEPQSNLVNIGGFVVNSTIFDFEVSESAEHGELLVTDMMNEYAKEHPVKIFKQDTWIPVGRPEDVARAEQLLCPERIETSC
ncbi:sugar phosphate nucleotidyltransferase [Candidatus Pacebacteria bacterium]|nr:sugar phosphate nucleotidyltransferase [Candidatus Paceibacterota bacterium]